MWNPLAVNELTLLHKHTHTPQGDSQWNPFPVLVCLLAVVCAKFSHLYAHNNPYEAKMYLFSASNTHHRHLPLFPLFFNCNHNLSAASTIVYLQRPLRFSHFNHSTVDVQTLLNRDRFVFLHEKPYGVITTTLWLKRLLEMYHLITSNCWEFLLISWTRSVTLSSKFQVPLINASVICSNSNLPAYNCNSLRLLAEGSSPAWRVPPLIGLSFKWGSERSTNERNPVTLDCTS